MPPMVTRLACETPWRSQIPRFTWLPAAVCQAATTRPEGAAAGKLPPGTSSRTGVPSELISQTSVVAFGAGGPEGVALADGLGEPGPSCPAGRVTSSSPPGVQEVPRMVAAPASRLPQPQ